MIFVLLRTRKNRENKMTRKLNHIALGATRFFKET